MQNLLAHAGSIATAPIPEVNINWLAIIVATAVAMAIGSLWYGPVLGNKWMKLLKLNKKEASENWKIPMLTMLVMAFVQAYILRHFIVYTAYFYPEMNELTIGLIVGFWVWVGFLLPQVLSSNMFARRSMALSKIEAGNQLITLLAIGAILAVWN